jgi:hypothetical protein
VSLRVDNHIDLEVKHGLLETASGCEYVSMCSGQGYLLKMRQDSKFEGGAIEGFGDYDIHK